MTVIPAETANRPKTDCELERATVNYDSLSLCEQGVIAGSVDVGGEIVPFCDLLETVATRKLPAVKILTPVDLLGISPETPQDEVKARVDRVQLDRGRMARNRMLRGVMPVLSQRTSRDLREQGLSPCLQPSEILFFDREAYGIAPRVSFMLTTRDGQPSNDQALLDATCEVREDLRPYLSFNRPVYEDPDQNVRYLGLNMTIFHSPEAREVFVRKGRKGDVLIASRKLHVL